MGQWGVGWAMGVARQAVWEVRMRGACGEDHGSDGRQMAGGHSLVAGGVGRAHWGKVGAQHAVCVWGA